MTKVWGWLVWNPTDFGKCEKGYDFGVSPKQLNTHMGVSKNRGTPKWMVYNGKPY